MAVFEFGLYRPDNTKPKTRLTTIRLADFPEGDPRHNTSDEDRSWGLAEFGKGGPRGDVSYTRVDVSYLEQTNGDGTTTRTIECGLDEVSLRRRLNKDPKWDVDIQNPVHTLFWSSEQQRYVVFGNITELVNPIQDPIPDPILARECWCARLFGQSFSSDTVRDPPDPMFCPLPQDTKVDGSPAGGEVCTALAVFSEDDLTILARESICLREDPLSKFSRSAWPLCFFWSVLMVLILLGTQYGRQIRGLVWRVARIQTTKLSERRQSRETNAGNANGDTTEDGSVQIVDDIELGGDIENSNVGDSPGNPEPTAPRGNPNFENDNEQESANSRSALPETSLAGEDAIAQEFGSVQNYQLLDRELRYQAERTGNEYVTQLWFSALYMEVRRYRYEWFQRRQERSRRRGVEDDTTGEASSDDDNDDDNAVVFSNLMRNPSQRLDSVFWCPPASPDGERLENVRNQGRRTHDENGNRVDGNRLRLKTKRFVMPEKKPQPLLGAIDSEDEDEDANENHNPDCGQSAVGDVVRICKEKNDDIPLQVPTKVATKETESDAEVGENVCSICLGEIEEGDLVGDIPCGHVFHKDCLKAWLVKNNHCPVCRMPGIALHPLLGTPAPTTHA